MLEDLFDDRLFLTGVSPCKIKKIEDGFYQTTIFYDEIPGEAWWVVVDYKNEPGFSIVGVSHFKDEDTAIRFREFVEPTTPLRSLGGKPPSSPLSFADYVNKKNSQGFIDFHPDRAYTSVVKGRSNRSELIYQSEEQFWSGLKKRAWFWNAFEGVSF